jgi:hypothetical protein
MPKATPLEIELNTLVKNDNALALSKIFDAYGGAITSKLKKLYSKYAKIDETLVLQSVNDALWGYYRNPHTFDPDKNTLLRFLEIAAERDLINLLKKERKFLDFKNDLPSDVELEEKMWNRASGNGDSPESDFINKEVIHKIDEQFKNHFKNERDIELAKLILGKVRETSRFSTLLEISELDIDEQQKLVKQHKDRIKKILDRHNIEVTLKNLMT